MRPFGRRKRGRMNIRIREEEERDYRRSEEIIREAFSYPGRVERGGIGCPSEHWMVHELRKRDGAGIRLVAEADGVSAGYVICSRAQILVGDTDALPVVNIGPIGVLPAYQRKGIGKALFHAVLERAAAAGCGAVMFFGRPEYCPRIGFVEAGNYGVSDRFGEISPAFLCMELKEGYLTAARGGRFFDSDVYDERRHREEIREFDRQFMTARENGAQERNAGE